MKETVFVMSRTPELPVAILERVDASKLNVSSQINVEQRF